MPRTRRPHLTLALLIVVTALAACASAGGPAHAESSAGTCRGPALDSAYLAYGPVYRDCDVDERATVRTRPELAPMPASAREATQAPACASAEVEFVVGEDGVPRGPIRTIRSSSPDFLNRLREAVPFMRYTPAMKDGKPVAQVVRYRTGIRRVVVSSGGRPAAASRAPNC